jgi:hypothetical protein
MRLLSFLTLVENQLRTRRPESSSGWMRRVNYHAGTAIFSHPVLGLTLTLRSCMLTDGQHNLYASWHGITGEVISNRSFYSGAIGFSWDNAAGNVADLMPAPALVARAPATSEEEITPRELVMA